MSFMSAIRGQENTSPRFESAKRQRRGVDQAALIMATAASGSQLKFKEAESTPEDFEAFFTSFVQRVIETWSEEQPTAQFWAYSSTLAASLIPLAEDGEVAELALNRLPSLLPVILNEMGATRFCFVATDDLPDHPEVLIIGGVSAETHVLGWADIIKEPDGGERLGRFSSFTMEDEKYVLLASSWMMRAFDVPNERPSWWALLRSALKRIVAR